MSRRIKKSKKIILYVIFACVCMTLLDLFVKPIYTIKCLIKIILFFVIPLFILTKRDRKSLIRMIKPKKEGLFKSISIGFIFYLYINIIGLYLGIYYNWKNIVDSNYYI